MNILFVTHYFPPELGAAQVRIYEFARYLVSKGHKVTVITGFSNYPEGVIPIKYRNKLIRKERFDGMDLIRTWVYASIKKNFLPRILNYLSFMFSAIIGGTVTGKCEIVFASSPPLSVGVPGYILSKLKRAKFIFEVRDLWPESAVAVGMLRSKLLIKLSEKFGNFLYAKAQKIVVATQWIRSNLIGKRVSFQKIELVTNGADVDIFQPGKKNNEVRKKHNLSNKFVVIYAGTHGLVHGLESVIKAARILKSQKDIVFLMVGEGVTKPKLIQLVRLYHLENVIFITNQTQNLLPSFINASDVGIAPTKNIEVCKGALPVKMFEYMACERPVILCNEGEARDLVMEANAGICIESENPKELADAILRLYCDKKLRDEFAINGRGLVVNNFSRKKLSAKFEQILLSV